MALRQGPHGPPGVYPERAASEQYPVPSTRQVLGWAALASAALVGLGALWRYRRASPFGG